MKALVIGGTGEIGREVTRFLAEKGMLLLVVSRSGSNQFSKYPNVQVANCDRHDIQRFQQLALYFSPSIVIDLAAYSRTDVLGTLSILPDSVDTYLVLSSIAVASSTEVGPSSLPIYEQKYPSSKKMNLYSLGKSAIEEVLLNKIPVLRSRLIILRTGEVIGAATLRELYFILRVQECQKDILVPDSGENLVHPTDVRDVAMAVLQLAVTASVPSGIYHIAGPKVYQLRELLHALLNTVGGRDVKLVGIPAAFILNEWGSFYYPFFPRSTIIDFSKLSREVNFQPCYTADASFARSMKIMGLSTYNLFQVQLSLSSSKLRPVLSSTDEARLIRQWCKRNLTVA